MTNLAIEHGPVEMVDAFPINSMVALSSLLCKRVPEGTVGEIRWHEGTGMSLMGRIITWNAQ